MVVVPSTTAARPAWLDHVTSDRFLSPAEFAHRYGQAFPGATFTDLHRTRAMCWGRPRRLMSHP
jgi:hypothetical protein